MKYLTGFTLVVVGYFLATISYVDPETRLRVDAYKECITKNNIQDHPADIKLTWCGEYLN